MSYSEQEKENALKRRDLSILVNMINDGENIDSLVVPHLTDALLVAITKKHKTLFNMVLEKNFLSNNYGFAYLHHAIRTHELFFIEKIVETYKKNNIDINEYDIEKDNCLHIAVSEDGISDDILIYLSNIGISWKDQNKYLQTPLHILLRKSQVIEKDNLLQIFKKNKEVFNIKDDLEITPLDIIGSAKYSKEWNENNQKIINLIKDLNEG